MRTREEAPPFSEGGGKVAHGIVGVQEGQSVTGRNGGGEQLGHCSVGSLCTSREKDGGSVGSDLASLPAVPSPPPAPPSACLQLRDIWLWLDARVLQELQLFHIICPRASSSLCQGEGGQSFGCLLYRTSLTAGQKEAAESLSCLQNLQQEELRRFNESIQTKNLPQPAVQLVLIEH